MYWVYQLDAEKYAVDTTGNVLEILYKLNHAGLLQISCANPLLMRFLWKIAVSLQFQ